MAVIAAEMAVIAAEMAVIAAELATIASDAGQCRLIGRIVGDEAAHRTQGSNSFGIGQIQFRWLSVNGAHQ